MDIPSSGDDPATQADCQTSRQGAPIFHQAQNFEVSGGTFTSITNIQHVPPSRPDFRMIPLGDIDLRDLIDGPGGVYRRLHKMGCVKRIYSARVDGRDSPMTVALYTGEDAKEEWSHEISRYSNLRHPNLMQIYAAAASNGIFATIFHDESISFDRCREIYDRHHPLWRFYLDLCMEELLSVVSFLASTHLIDRFPGCVESSGTPRLPADCGINAGPPLDSK
ncbi:hypothetical protein FB45DRAFT_230778 [Roridomyces roridus]|uniref:Protein kinase domain-containing protein n=1 Tax=Roridomyces roridus TaxID=1738132 RepID=A0AAD7BBS8_9AGAR|nr:hypothetical protein FB45DRAFT_230778 [Roridomyces roridus]